MRFVRDELPGSSAATTVVHGRPLPGGSTRAVHPSTMTSPSRPLLAATSWRVASSPRVEKTTVRPLSSTIASAALRVRRSVSSSRSSCLTTTASPSPVVSPTRTCRCARTGLVESPDASAVHGGRTRAIVDPRGQPAALGDGGAVAVEDGGVVDPAVPDQVAQDGRGVTAEGQGRDLDGEAQRAALVDQVGTYGGSRAVDVARDPVGPRVRHREEQDQRPHGERHEEQPAEHQPQPASKAHGRTRQTFRRTGKCARDARDWDDGLVGDQAGTATEDKAGLRAAVIAARRAFSASARADAASLHH